MDQEISIDVVDPNSDALKLAKERYEKIPSSNYIRSVKYHEVISNLDGEIDVAIIATNSDVRKQVIDSLIASVLEIA